MLLASLAIINMLEEGVERERLVREDVVDDLVATLEIECVAMGRGKVRVRRHLPHSGTAESIGLQRSPISPDNHVTPGGARVT